MIGGWGEKNSGRPLDLLMSATQGDLAGGWGLLALKAHLLTVIFPPRQVARFIVLLEL